MMETKRKPDRIIRRSVLVLLFVILAAFVGKNLEDGNWMRRSIRECEEKYSFKLLENGVVSLKISGGIPGEGYQIKIENERGREIWKRSFSSGRKECQIRLKKGNYCVRLCRRLSSFLLERSGGVIQITCKIAVGRADIWETGLVK